MPQPLSGQVHVDVALTNISIAYMQQQGAFVATKVFPVVPSEKQSNKYFIFDQNAWFIDSMQRRAPATESAGSGYTISTDSFFCDPYALHKDIPDQVRDNTDFPLNPDRNATQWLTQMALLRLEVQWATDFFATGIWGTDVTGVVANPSATQFINWNDQAASDPIGDVRAGVRTVLSNTGFKPNRLVLGYNVWEKIQDHPDIVDRLKITDDKVVTPQLLAKIFDIEQVWIAQAVKATNNEGGTAAYSFVHGKHALLTYAASEPALEVPSGGYTFMWTGVSGGLGLQAGVRVFRMEQLRADRAEIEMAWTNKKVAAALGYFFSGAVA